MVGGGGGKSNTPVCLSLLSGGSKAATLNPILLSVTTQHCSRCERVRVCVLLLCCVTFS